MATTSIQTCTLRQNSQVGQKPQKAPKKTRPKVEKDANTLLGYKLSRIGGGMASNMRLAVQWMEEGRNTSLKLLASKRQDD